VPESNGRREGAASPHAEVGATSRLKDTALAHRTLRTILVPTDFSASAAEALRWAEAFARAFQAKIVVLHVLDLPVAWTQLGGLGAVPTRVPQSVAENLSREAQILLETTTRDVAHIEQRILRTGHPRELILTVAQEVRADAIVMGTASRGGLSQLFIGSVAQHVVGHAGVPVWTVRAAATAD
jgi:nucleotide-binding universal stress UspA family protein